ncbi:MAG: hypothetical protein LBS54_03415 [Dysgonamonadaceae bacterium]|nr:hypothetical protein [Dysgonamonadaceae bacterium]
MMFAGVHTSPTLASGHLRRLRRDTSDACVGETPAQATDYIDCLHERLKSL